MKANNGLYSIFLRRLKEIRYQKEVIPFPYVFEKLCRNFSIKKSECLEILRIFKENGMIEIICGHGVRITKFSGGEIYESFNNS